MARLFTLLLLCSLSLFARADAPVTWTAKDAQGSPTQNASISSDASAVVIAGGGIVLISMGRPFSGAFSSQ